MACIVAMMLSMAVTSAMPVPESPPSQYAITLYSPNGEAVVDLNLSHACSVEDLLRDLCATASRSDCVEYMDSVSSHHYKTFYTPSRPSSTVEDYYADRIDLIRYLQMMFKYERYLEIGCDKDVLFKTVKDLFPVAAVGVDPSSGGTLRMTSDMFFAQNTQLFDLIMIDGLHEAKQVWRDIHLALRFLAPNGTIVLHDMNPRAEHRQVYPMVNGIEHAWNGDCWKAGVMLRMEDNLEIVIADFDHGVGVVRRRPNRHRLPIEWEIRLLKTDDAISSLTYSDLDANRETFLRLKSFQEVKDWLVQT